MKNKFRTLTVFFILAFTMGCAFFSKAPADSLAGKIVFESDYDIWIINANGEGLQNLTNTPDVSEVYPTISPDGSMVAYQDLMTRNVFTIKADGSFPQQITDEQALSRSTRWTPDGKEIFICTMTLAANGHAVFSGYFLDLSSGEKRNSDQCIGDTSPDGKKYYQVKDNQLTVQSFAGNYQKGYTLGPADSMVYSGRAWSPDGKRILFGAYSLDDPNPAKPGTILAVLDLDSGEITNLIIDQYMNNCAAWSPDGRKIAFTSDRLNDQGKLQIFIMNSDGSNIQLLSGSMYTNCMDWQSR